MFVKLSIFQLTFSQTLHMTNDSWHSLSISFNGTTVALSGDINLVILSVDIFRQYYFITFLTFFLLLEIWPIEALRLARLPWQIGQYDKFAPEPMYVYCIYVFDYYIKLSGLCWAFKWIGSLVAILRIGCEFKISKTRDFVECCYWCEIWALGMVGFGETPKHALVILTILPIRSSVLV